VKLQLDLPSALYFELIQFTFWVFVEALDLDVALLQVWQKQSPTTGKRRLRYSLFAMNLLGGLSRSY